MQICLRMWSRNTALMILLGALFLLAPAPSPAQQKALPALDQKLDPLRARFNQDAGKVRLIVIVDPTCPPCRWGASEIQKPRAIHYIDPNGFSGKQYSTVLNVPYHAPAWDVYFAFGPDVRWEDRAPTPTDWMYQGEGFDRVRLLDGRKFAERVQKLLATADSKAAKR